jgi:hypothetical protein
MKARRLVAHFCALSLALAFAVPTYGVEPSISQPNCSRAFGCGFYEQRSVSAYIANRCYFLDGKDQSVAQITSVDFPDDPNFPRLPLHILSLS